MSTPREGGTRGDFRTGIYVTSQVSTTLELPYIDRLIAVAADNDMPLPAAVRAAIVLGLPELELAGKDNKGKG